MVSKPATGDGYSSNQFERVRQTCLYIATKLGDLLDEIVVVGGLVPYLLVDQNNLPLGLEPHVGTMDLDLGLELTILNEERYRELSARLRDAGFEPGLNEKGNRTFQRWTTTPPQPVTVDFLIPPFDETDQDNLIRHIESDLAAIVTQGLELAFQDRSWIELSGSIPSGAWASREIPVCSPGHSLCSKRLPSGIEPRTRTPTTFSMCGMELGLLTWQGAWLHSRPTPTLTRHSTLSRETSLAMRGSDLLEWRTLLPRGLTITFKRMSRARRRHFSGPYAANRPRGW